VSETRRCRAPKGAALGCRPAFMLTAAAQACAPGGGPVVLLSPAPTCLPDLVDYVKISARCCPARPVLRGRACTAAWPSRFANFVRAISCCGGGWVTAGSADPKPCLGMEAGRGRGSGARALGVCQPRGVQSHKASLPGNVCVSSSSVPFCMYGVCVRAMFTQNVHRTARTASAATAWRASAGAEHLSMIDICAALAGQTGAESRGGRCGAHLHGARCCIGWVNTGARPRRVPGRGCAGTVSMAARTPKCPQPRKKRGGPLVRAGPGGPRRGALRRCARSSMAAEAPEEACLLRVQARPRRRRLRARTRWAGASGSAAGPRMPGTLTETPRAPPPPAPRTGSTAWSASSTRPQRASACSSTRARRAAARRSRRPTPTGCSRAPRSSAGPCGARWPGACRWRPASAACGRTSRTAWRRWRGARTAQPRPCSCRAARRTRSRARWPSCCTPRRPGRAWLACPRRTSPPTWRPRGRLKRSPPRCAR